VGVIVKHVEIVAIWVALEKGIGPSSEWVWNEGGRMRGLCIDTYEYGHSHSYLWLIRVSYGYEF
jgi:hypothetical protein